MSVGTNSTTVLEGQPHALLEASPPGQLFGSYRLLEPIGRGGMGVIWRAEDTRLCRTVAIKVLPANLARDPRSKARFLQEARAASALDHPNVCCIHEVGETPDLQLYLVMPCYDGETLDDRIDRGPLPVPEVLDIAGQIVRGLAKAHQKGIVHRDLKPSNLMMTSDDILKILDFGIAKLMSGVVHLTQTGSAVGTPAYMSPEQMLGREVDHRTDLWSLGVVIHELLTGHRPFPGENAVALREAILRSEPEPLRRSRPDVPAKLERLVIQLLAKDPAARPASAAAVEASLRLLGGKTPGWRTARSLWIILSLLGLVTVGAFSLPKLSRPPKPGTLVALTPPAPSPAVPSDRRQSVAVLGFQDPSGEPSRQWLGPALTEMLTAELAAGAKFRVVSSERTAKAQRSLSLPKEVSPDRSSMERLHALVGADFAMTGTYLPLADQNNRQIRLDIRILKMPEGDTIASVVEAGTEAELFDLVARAGSKLRNALGFSLPTEAERLQARGLLPSRPEAIRFYVEALARLRIFDSVGARSLLERAEILEPTSVAIQSALAEAWMMQGQDAQARQAAMKAFDHRGSLPQEARLAIEARFYETGKDWGRASGIYRSLKMLFPDELDYGIKLADTLSMAGRAPEALAVLAELSERPLPEGNDPRIDVAEMIVANRKGDFPRVEKAAQAAVTKGRRLGNWLITARGLLYQANLATTAGRHQEAKNLLQEAEGLALRAGDRSTAARVDATLSVILQQQGDLAGAEQVSQRALNTARDLGTALGTSIQLYSMGTIYRQRGELDEALRRLEDSLATFRRIDYRMWESSSLVEIGLIDLAKGNAEKARSLFTTALDLSRMIRRAENEGNALYALSTLNAYEGNLEEALRLKESVLQVLLEVQNPALAAEALSSSADLLAHSGELSLARRRLLQARALGRRAANKLLTGYILGINTRFALRAGNLASARTASESQLQIARETGAKPLEAVALRGLAEVAQAAGEIRQAHNLLSDAYRISAAGGDELTKAASQVDLARVELDAGDFDSALTLATDAATWHQARRFPGGEATALAILAEAQLRLGRPAEARQSAAQAQSRIPGADLELRLALAPAFARVEASRALRTRPSAL